MALRERSRKFSKIYDQNYLTNENHRGASKVKNNAHQSEPLEKRLTRFKNGSPVESLETLLNSLDNFFNNEITVASREHQTTLLFLGIHAVALTISEIFWGLGNEAGYKKFLSTFVDGSTKETKFSNIAEKMHNWRNILAHQWLAPSGYKIQYNYEMKAGFILNNDLLTINPRIYYDYYIKAFSAGGKIWQYGNVLDATEFDEAKKRMIKKFIKR